MLDSLARHLEVSPAVAGALLLLLVVQLSTQIYALVDLTRRDAVRGGRKWVWALVVVLGNLPGAIAYFAAGRAVSTAEVSGGSGATTAGEEAVRRAIDAVYGPSDRR
jgi:hypothetical protein